MAKREFRDLTAGDQIQVGDEWLEVSLEFVGWLIVGQKTAVLGEMYAPGLFKPMRRLVHEEERTKVVEFMKDEAPVRWTPKLSPGQLQNEMERERTIAAGGVL